LPTHQDGSRPSTTTCTLSGTRNHSSPNARMYRASIAELVTQALNTPPLVECESPIAMSSPGAIMPFSGNSWCKMPPRPNSKKFVIPYFRTSLRTSATPLAASTVGGGARWSSTRYTRSGSQTRSTPSRSSADSM
jgi:hypothetical protein